MCCSPIPIKSRSIFRQPLYKAQYLVPCGVCGECLKQRRKDLLPRLEREFKDAAWSSLLLLTYDENHVRDIVFYPSNEVRLKYKISSLSVRIPAFRQSDFKNYFDVFRRKLYELYPQYKDRGIKFFCASEYGSNPNGTMRGHFHLVTHFPLDVSLLDKKNIIKLQCRLWRHGATSLDLPNRPSYEKLIVQNALAASRYVSKYVSKQIDDVDRRFKVLRSWMSQMHLNKSWYIHSSLQKMFRDLKPKVWYSRGYGISCLPDLSGLDDFRKYDIISRGILKSDASGYYKFSRYFIDKLTHKFEYLYYGTASSKEKIHLRILTPFGAYFKFKKFAFALQHGALNIKAVYPELKSHEALKLSFAKVFGHRFLCDLNMKVLISQFAKSFEVERLQKKMCRLVYNIYNLTSKYNVRFDINMKSPWRQNLFYVDFIKSAGLDLPWRKIQDMQLVYASGASKKFNDSSDVFLRVKNSINSFY